MKYYKIIIIGLLLANNKVSPYGTIVKDEQIVGDPEEVLKGGYIVEATEEEIEAAFPKPEETPAEEPPIDPQSLVITPEPGAAPAVPAPDAPASSVDAAPAAEATVVDPPAAAPDPAAILNKGKGK